MAELQGLLNRVIQRILKLLTRTGYLIEERDMRYLAEAESDRALTPLQAAACTYRIALGPRTGQKVLSLHTVPSRAADSTQSGCVNAHGFSLHAAVRCGADEAQGARTPGPLYHPPGHCQRTAQAQSNGPNHAAAQEPLARRHHPVRDVAAGVHAALSRTGSASRGYI